MTTDRLVPTRWQNPLNRVLNLALYLILCFMIGTGWIMWQRLPRGSGHGPGRGQQGRETPAILGLTRHEWGDWHLYAGIAFLALSVLHLILNWTWLVKIAASRHAWRLWTGLAAGAAIIAILALLPVRG